MIYSSRLVKHAGRLAICILVTLLFTSCGGDRPTVGEWEPIWRSAQDAVPDIDALSGPGEETACRDALAALRELRPEVEPTPDEVIDGTVSDWFNVAEAAMFGCPPTSDGDYSETFANLTRLAAEVESVLDLDR